MPFAEHPLLFLFLLFPPRLLRQPLVPAFAKACPFYGDNVLALWLDVAKSVKYFA
jgi:hypothetical protein